MSTSSEIKTIWEGVYATFEDALAVGKGFGSERWMDRIVKQLLDYRREKELNRLTIPPRPSDLPMLVSITDAKRIIDWGGSSGWTYDFIKQAIPQFRIEQYIIFEREEVLFHMENVDLHSTPVSYVTENQVSLFKERIDVLYANSVLQYIYDDSFLLNSINQLNPEWILVEDFMGGDFDDFFSLQNYYESRIPVRFRNRKNFIHSLQGYNLELSKPYSSSILGVLQELPMHNFPLDKRISTGETLLFRRKD